MLLPVPYGYENTPVIVSFQLQYSYKVYSNFVSVRMHVRLSSVLVYFSDVRPSSPPVLGKGTRGMRYVVAATKETSLIPNETNRITTHDIHTIIHVPIHCLSKSITIFEKEEKEIGEGVKVHIYKYMRVE